MPCLYKRRTIYYAQFEKDGSKRQHSLKTGNKREAQKLFISLQEAAERGEWNPFQQSIADYLKPVKRPQSLDEWMDAFMDSRAMLRARTIETYAQILRLFKDEGADLNAFLLKRRDVTRQKYYRHLRVFYSWIVKQGWLEANPCDDIVLPRPVKKEAHYFTRSEIKHLVQFINEHANERESAYLPQMIEFVCQTGLRLGEVCALRWDWIQSDFCLLPITNSFSPKSRREEGVYLTARAKLILTSVDQSGSHVFSAPTPMQVSKRFLYWRRRAGLKRGSFHSLRHTCATWMIEGGASIYVVKKHMRHSSILVTERYMHLAQTDVQIRIEQSLTKLHTGLYL